MKSSKLISNVEHSLRVQLEKRLVYLGKEFLGEKVKLTIIRKSALIDINHVNKETLDLKENLTSCIKQSQLDTVIQTL